MLKVMTATLALCALATLGQAADGDKPPQRQRPQLTEEQKKERQALIDKYDKNKDGKLDADERGAMSAEDKEKMAKFGGRGQRRPADAK